jgi:hypothetical protein
MIDVCNEIIEELNYKCDMHYYIEPDGHCYCQENRKKITELLLKLQSLSSTVTGSNSIDIGDIDIKIRWGDKNNIQIITSREFETIYKNKKID